VDVDGAIEAHEREKWNQRYLEGTHGTLPPDRLLIEAFDRYIEPLFPDAGRRWTLQAARAATRFFLPRRGGRCG
jgi:hypothetical protein